MKLSYDQILTAKQAYLSLQGIPAHARFHYGVRKNLDSLQPAVQEMARKGAESNGLNEKAKEYQEARIALNKEYAEKDEAGNPKTEGAHFVIPADKRVEFDAKIEALREQHKPVLDEIDAARKAYVEWCQTEAGDFTLHMIHLDHVPDMPPELYDALSFMFTDDIGNIIVTPTIKGIVHGKQ